MRWCENLVKPERTRVTLWRMRVACWISKATRAYAQTRAHLQTHAYTQAQTHAHTLREICNTFFFPRQKSFRERDLRLRYACIACHVIKTVVMFVSLRIVTMCANARSLHPSMSPEALPHCLQLHVTVLVCVGFLCLVLVVLMLQR